MTARTHPFRGVFGRLVLAATLALLIVGLPVAVPPRVAHADSSFVVDVPPDVAPASPDGTCFNASVGGCTLREAIQEASASGTATTITFAASLANATITLDNSLGPLDVRGVNITIDGGDRNISVSGSNLSLSPSVFRIQGNNNVLRNLIIKNARLYGIEIGDVDIGVGSGNNNLIFGVKVISSGSHGIYVKGRSSGGNNNTIRESLIGSTSYTSCTPAEANKDGIYLDSGVLGTQIILDTIICNTQDGLSISGAGSTSDTTRTLVQENYIGTDGTTALGNGWAGVAIYGDAHRLDLFSNVISGNSRQGVYIAGALTDDVALTGNLIGLNFNGSAAVPNTFQGVAVDGLTNANVTISGFNRISGNLQSGIWVKNSTHVSVKGNYIGTNYNGTAAIGNGQHGVLLSDATSATTIGGTTASDRNIISGNTLSGVYLTGSGTSSNVIDINMIGLNAAGTAALPNGNTGIAVVNTNAGNTIGSSLGITQFISGNLREGIYVQNANGTFIGPSNRIGVAANGVTPIGNGLHGIMLNGTINSSVFPSVVANNGGAGVTLVGATATNNMIVTGGSIYNNRGLPIDLQNDGATANDPGDADTGPNNLLNYPVITSASGSTVSGTTCPNCTVWIYRPIGNPAAPGGGGSYVMNAIANSSGVWSATLTGGLTRTTISMVACESPCTFSSNTSEMSPHGQAFLPLLIR